MLLYVFDTYIKLSTLSQEFSEKETRNYFRKTYWGLDNKTYTVFCKLLLGQLLYFTFFQRKFNIVTLLHIFFCLYHIYIIFFIIFILHIFFLLIFLELYFGKKLNGFCKFLKFASLIFFDIVNPDLS